MMKFNEFVEGFKSREIGSERKELLNDLVNHVLIDIKQNGFSKLNFICTHNSRRSQISQIWAQIFAERLKLPILSYSGGVELTAFNERAVSAFTRKGLKISSQGIENPVYFIEHNDQHLPFCCFSKKFDHEINPSENFIAIMTCADADENCPFIPGASLRYPLRYVDPKIADDTPLEQNSYDNKLIEIGSEIYYMFNRIKEELETQGIR